MLRAKLNPTPPAAAPLSAREEILRAGPKLALDISSRAGRGAAAGGEGKGGGHSPRHFLDSWEGAAAGAVGEWGWG